jgi:FeS assembly SUF system protein
MLHEALTPQNPHPESHSGGTIAPDALKTLVIAALRGVYDPEIHINIYDLGLIYEVAIDADAAVAIHMTLTAPGCPVAQTFPAKVEAVIAAVPGVHSAKVELVWEPPWTQDRMSDAARLELGWL